MTAIQTSAGTIVLVHGAFVDGSGWEGVYSLLKEDGYDVTIVQNPTASLTDDVALTKRAIAAAPGKVILVGHSYGGAVITEAGTDPKVAALVYIAAFAPDKGESLNSLIKSWPPGGPVPPILPPVDGYLVARQGKVPRFVCCGREHRKGRVHGQLAGAVGPGCFDHFDQRAGMEDQPTWYLVATEDRMIPPPSQRQMAQRAKATFADAKGSHAIYESQPKAVVALIERAAKSMNSELAAAN